jgi:hypothetical protein
VSASRARSAEHQEALGQLMKILPPTDVATILQLAVAGFGRGERR